MAFVPGMFKLVRGIDHDFVLDSMGGVVAYAPFGGPWFAAPGFGEDLAVFIERINEVRERPDFWERPALREALKELPYVSAFPE